ncbi:hypothetical protein ACB092_03G099300 [Castanea dentata]
MTLRLLSWNVRGLNNPRKREVCKNLLKEWKCDFVCIQEAKVSSIDGAFVRSLWGSPFTDWAVLDAVQSSGGVFLIWDKRVFENVLLRGVVDDFVWACTGVYGPNGNGQRPNLWPVAWCLVGDFNIIRYPSERLGYFIENNSLVDLPLEGASFT